MTAIVKFNHESQELELITQIAAKTPLEIVTLNRISSYSGNSYILGINLYAVTGGEWMLFETYEDANEAHWVRCSIIKNVAANVEMVII